MKRIFKSAAAMLLLLTLLLTVVSCGGQETPTTAASTAAGEGIWASALYREDTTLGEGANTLTVVVEAEGKSVTFTIHTDAATVGEALYALGIINDPTFFHICNGMLADWDADQAYWCFSQGGEMLFYGVGDAQATTAGNPTYEIIYTK